MGLLPRGYRVDLSVTSGQSLNSRPGGTCWNQCCLIHRKAFSRWLFPYLFYREVWLSTMRQALWRASYQDILTSFGTYGAGPLWQIPSRTRTRHISASPDLLTSFLPFDNKRTTQPVTLRKLTAKRRWFFPYSVLCVSDVMFSYCFLFLSFGIWCYWVFGHSASGLLL